MESLDMIQAVENWVVTVLPEFTTSFDFPPEELFGNLPLVIAEIDTDGTSDATEASFPQAGYQQTALRLWSISVRLFVSPDPAQAAAESLYAYVDAIGRSLLHNIKLGDNVVLSQFYDASYIPAEVEYSDGTRARQVTIAVAVGETIGV